MVGESMIEDLDDVLEHKWNEGELLNPCECGQNHVEITEQDLEWQKRDLWICDFTYLCWECESVWTERMYLLAYLSEYKMINKRGDEEE